ncbi:hypothetical protein PHYSODRAFT_327019 [Phytophthora sojae]|uniref:Crinkler effector protein N-terminal domain-containing protein n=1 Tax=Phytophthora sojae (strain P6497) TaxID=1094619 RepID=G4YWH5_PHYSP|nr:hypothetical protein PHYSODRAFT_327019 [Phytophthora sojae]EGZ26089.1 hypothetical protein PHYSODRAFT_327019 [Phytophthora sojae]|eukprot:XP_009521377.1 hypothetical protein PHYSODRAFT_327019 [Phytophthora sojae]
MVEKVSYFLAFPVDIDEKKSVGHLKDAIKEKKMYRFPANHLHLEDGGLKGAGVKAVTIGKASGLPEMLDGDGNGQPRGFKEMNPLLWIKNPDNFGGNFQAGEDEVHVLVVVSKQAISASIVSQDGVFDHCSDPFFAQFPTVEQVGDWLEFSSLLPLTKRQKLYIRSSYKVIAEQALLNPDRTMVKYAVVTGTPGIGKSVFVNYIMWRLTKEKKRVLFFDSEGNFYFDGTNMLTCKVLPDKSNRQFWSSDLWCLVDSLDPTSIAGLPYRICSILLASTPRRDCIGEFKKLAPTPDVLYMPLWKEEELSAIASMYPNARDEWKHRFKCLGGVPRLVLEDIGTDPQVLLETACNSCSLDECKTLVSINSEINSRTQMAQTLIHICSQEPYTEYQVVYASELAMRVIARTKLVSNRRNMESFLSACNGNPLAQSMCGYIFEPHCLRLLHEGGSFEYRELLSGADMQRQRKRGRRDIVETEITIPSSSKPSQIVERVEAGQVANQLYVPRTSNYVAIDAWMPQFGGFQVTVGKTHDIKAGAADDLAKLGPGGNQLFFLLPPLYYKSYLFLGFWTSMKSVAYFPALMELSIINQPTICELEGLNLSSNKIRRLENLDALVKLEKLWVNLNQLERLDGLWRLTKLTQLWACRNRIDRIDTALNGCVNLTELNLADNRLSSFKGLLSLMNLDQLAVLDTVELSARNKQIAEATMIKKKMIRHAETIRNQAEHHMETSVSALVRHKKEIERFLVENSARKDEITAKVSQDMITALEKKLECVSSCLQDRYSGVYRMNQDFEWLRTSLTYTS